MNNETSNILWKILVITNRGDRVRDLILLSVLGHLCVLHEDMGFPYLFYLYHVSYSYFNF